jgi:K+ transporter
VKEIRKAGHQGSPEPALEEAELAEKAVLCCRWRLRAQSCALTKIQDEGYQLDPMTTSYFLSRDIVIPTIGGGMAPWREKLFAQIHHNASGAAAFLNLPTNAVVELGSKIEI